MPLPLVTRADLGVRGYTARKYMQPGEQDVLLALVASVSARCMVEIGVNEGLTARAVLRNIATIEHYVGIDIDDDYRFEIPAQERERPKEPGHLVRADPRFELIIRGYGRIISRCDVVFIDGDHGRNAVMIDTELATALVNPDGLIIWHDYGNPAVEVTAVLDHLHDSGRGRDIRHVEGTWLAFEGR